MFIATIFLATIAFMPQQAEAACLLKTQEPLVFVETATDKVALTKRQGCKDDYRFTFEFDPTNDCFVEVAVTRNFTDVLEHEAAREGAVEGQISVGGEWKRKRGDENPKFGETPFKYNAPVGEFTIPLSEKAYDLVMRMTKYDVEKHWNKLSMRWRHVGDKKFQSTITLNYKPYELSQAAAMCAAKLNIDGLAEEAGDNGDPKPESDQAD